MEGTAKFFQKVKWLRAFAPFGDHDGWQLILALNTVRNKVAHKFDGPERKKALNNLRKEFARAVPEHSSILDQQEWGDFNIVIGAAMESQLFLIRIQQQIGNFDS